MEDLKPLLPEFGIQHTFYSCIIKLTICKMGRGCPWTRLGFWLLWWEPVGHLRILLPLPPPCTFCRSSMRLWWGRTRFGDTGSGPGTPGARTSGPRWSRRGSWRGSGQGLSRPACCQSAGTKYDIQILKAKILGEVTESLQWNIKHASNNGFHMTKK